MGSNENLCYKLCYTKLIQNKLECKEIRIDRNEILFTLFLPFSKVNSYKKITEIKCCFLITFQLRDIQDFPVPLYTIHKLSSFVYI